MKVLPTIVLASMLAIPMIGLSQALNTDTRGGNWSSVPVFNQAPLEVKIGTYSNGMSPDALIMVLWNDGSNNRLDAVRVPPPYDGTGVTSDSIEITQTLFALGDICTTSSAVIVPYINDFNVEVARFDGSNWSTSTIPGTTTNFFDNADCAQNNNGVFIGTHDFSDKETELFRSTNQGGSYTFYGRYTSVAGPFDGGTREPLATSFGTRYLSGLNQTTGGMMRYTRVDTNMTPPVITHQNIRPFPAPAGFTFVKESAARHFSGQFFYTYNTDGNARTVTVDENNPANFTESQLGPINNMGSQYDFQGGGLVTVVDENGVADNINVLWGDYFIVDPNNLGPATTDPSYPLTGVGGPADACRVDFSDGSMQIFVAGSRVGSVGTDIHRLDLPPPPIFADGFESGDTSSWTFCE